MAVFVNLTPGFNPYKTLDSLEAQRNRCMIWLFALPIMVRQIKNNPNPMGSDFMLLVREMGLEPTPRKTGS